MFEMKETDSTLSTQTLCFDSMSHRTVTLHTDTVVPNLDLLQTTSRIEIADRILFCLQQTLG